MHMTHEDEAPQGRWKRLAVGYDESLVLVPQALAAEGFGIVSQIDLHETFKAKLGVGFRRYRVLGACNPGFAHKALSENLRLGILLPCNVVIYEQDDGSAMVGVVDPNQSFRPFAESNELAELVEVVRGRLNHAFESLPS